MKTGTKIAIGVAAGFVAGVMFLGTAMAATHVAFALHRGANASWAARAADGNRFDGRDGRFMMGGGRFSDRPGFGEMRDFMERYRNADGTYDMDRMRSEVGSGTVTPPCVGRGGAYDTPGAQGPGTRRGPGMMRGYDNGPGSGYGPGYGMMGPRY